MNVQPGTGRRPETQILNNTNDKNICTWIIVMFAKSATAMYFIQRNPVKLLSTFTPYLLSANTTAMRVHKHDIYRKSGR
jgi:hypothetical protein